MNFKFNAGQSVEYKPIGGLLGLYTVIRQMPEELRAFDRKYRIKSEHEGFERTVLECDLREPATQEPPHVMFRPLRHDGR